MKYFTLKYFWKYLLAVFLLGWVGCTSESGETLSDETEKGFPICWNVESDSTRNSRVLVDDDVLQNACTPTEAGCEAIGVWGKYDIDENGLASTHEIFDNVPLTYAAKGEDTNPYNDWNYPGESVFWRFGAEYCFRACFPQSLMNELMTQMDATVFQGSINTLTLQEDILVAATSVDTNTENFIGPVKLDMQHIFAALKFKVKSADGFTPANGEALTSCWLQNTSNATDLFSASGYLVHSGNASPEITWYPHTSSKAPMYVWKHQGVDFSSEKVLYTSNGGLDGGGYTHNDGWLLIIPQTVKAGTLQFCYTLKHAGDQVFSVNIPAVTFVYGWRYTYVLEIRGSEVDVTLSIKPWNHLESNHEITI